MSGQRFKINTPTVAIEPGRDTKIIHIPKDSPVKVIREDLDGNQLLRVEWNGRTLSMFARDLSERGELISGGEG